MKISYASKLNPTSLYIKVLTRSQVKQINQLKVIIVTGEVLVETYSQDNPLKHAWTL